MAIEVGLWKLGGKAETVATKPLTAACWSKSPVIPLKT